MLAAQNYTGLGASGMVMGALGLISVPPGAQWGSGPVAFKRLAQAIAASVLLFILLGVDPKSDVIAHTGGFVVGRRARGRAVVNAQINHSKQGRHGRKLGDFSRAADLDGVAGGSARSRLTFRYFWSPMNKTSRSMMKSRTMVISRINIQRLVWSCLNSW